MHRFMPKTSWSLSLMLAVSSVALACGGTEPEQKPEPKSDEALVMEELAARGLDPAGAAGGSHCTPGGTLFAPGEISLPERSEYRITFSADGQTAYYHVDTAEPPTQIIYVSHRVNGHFTPGVVASFSGTYADSDPFLAPDGRSLYFSSARPVNGVPREDTDLWVVRRTASGEWGEPEHLGPQVNSDRQELFASVTNDGTLYFASGTFDSDFDIYSAEPRGTGFAPAERLGVGVNSTDYWEYNSQISPDGRLLIFASLNREEGYGLGDLYASVKLGGRWLKAINLGPGVNTEKDEFHPTLSPDGKGIYFVRQTWDPYVPSDFYHVELRCLLP
ncbi:MULTISPECIES: PD40 domain-containing protein [Corallococcus]|uniref:TolB family protein n=1 Tax=Corallococcus TaxID=83461 RepID=UPI00117E9788|nr:MULTISPECIES: PD40 domain-containing protein [Corallococcus]NBD12345.1 Xaa-Pro aminopeptidase [Corallococcus silvisoli]TSC25295.1 Xaa-Pro aminopeptidase [Corallococcus sp. Z5C101001]